MSSHVWIRRLFQLFLAVLLAPFALAAALWLWEQMPLAVDASFYEASAKRYSATIRRDSHGIPHIRGGTDADAAFGLAYAHAEDDFETIRDVIMTVRGELASIEGANAAQGDYLIRWMGIWDLVEERYATDLSPEVRAVAEAYADGINLWASRNSEALVRGFLPVRGQDIAAGFVFKTPFFYGFDEVLKELNGNQRQKPIAEPPTAFRRADGVTWGSNAVAVAPSRSADGTTRLWINSHQPLSGPVSWYEAHVKSNQGLDVYGGTFPGSPIMLHGFNRNIGWASTVNRPDLVDVYSLTTNPDNPKQYLLDGEWQDFEETTAEIEVKIFGALRWTFEQPVLRSKHGPVMETKHGTYAVRYVGMNEVRQLEQYYRMNHAQDLESFMDAMRIHAVPSINYTYADSEGHIAFIYNARFPKRSVGWDWTAYLPGDRSELIWESMEDFDRLPMLIDPPTGLVGNANHTPFAATVGEANLNPDAYPPEWGIERTMTNRAHRFLETWGANPSISRDEMIDYKFDHRYSQASRQGRVIEQLVTADFGDDPLLSRAQAILRDWDLDTSAQSRQAALGVLTLDRVFRSHQDPLTMPPQKLLESSLRDAASHLERHFNQLDPKWGDVNRHRRGPRDVPVSGAPDVLRAIYGERQVDGTFTASEGDGFMALVEWKPNGRRHAWGLHQYGAHVRDHSAPHATDQMDEYIREELRAIPLSEAALSASTESKYSP